MRQSYRLIYNTTINWIAKLSESLVQLFLLPFMITRLGKDGYAIFVLVYSINVLIDWVRDGIGQSIAKYTSEYLSTNRQDKINQILSTICPATLFLGALFALVINLLGSQISVWMNIPPQFRSVFQWSLLMMSILIMLNLFAMSFVGILYGLQRYDICSVLLAIFRFVRAGVIVGWFLFVSSSIMALVVITFTCEILFQISLVITVYRLLPNLRVSIRQFQQSVLRSLTGFSILVMLIQISALLTGDAVSWILSNLISPEFVTYIVIMNTPAVFATRIVQSATLTIMPVASKYQALNDMNALKELLIRGTRYVVILCCCFSFFVIPLMSIFLKLWMGADYVFLSPFMIVINLSNLIQLSSSPAHHMLKGLGALKKILAARIASGLLCLGIIVVGTVSYHSPFWAVAIGLSSAFILLSVYQIVLCASIINVSLRDFFWQAYGGSLLLFATINIFSVVAIHYLLIENVALLLSFLLFVSVSFVFLHFRFFFNDKEKHLVRTIYSALRNRVSSLTNLGI